MELSVPSSSLLEAVPLPTFHPSQRPERAVSSSCRVCSARHHDAAALQPPVDETHRCADGGVRHRPHHDTHQGRCPPGLPLWPGLQLIWDSSSRKTIRSPEKGGPPVLEPIVLLTEEPLVSESRQAVLLIVH